MHKKKIKTMRIAKTYKPLWKTAKQLLKPEKLKNSCFWQKYGIRKACKQPFFENVKHIYYLKMYKDYPDTKKNQKKRELAISMRLDYFPH